MKKREFPKDAICPLCSGKIEESSTTFTVDLGNGVLIVREVPAQICRQCGEEWFDKKVSHRLDQLAEGMRERGAEVEIVTYQTDSKVLVEA